MLSGRPPFRGASEYLTFQMILDHTVCEFPPDSDDDAGDGGAAATTSSFTPAARDLVERLLRQEPPTRIGACFFCGCFAVRVCALLRVPDQAVVRHGPCKG